VLSKNLERSNLLQIIRHMTNLTIHHIEGTCHQIRAVWAPQPAPVIRPGKRIYAPKNSLTIYADWGCGSIFLAMYRSLYHRCTPGGKAYDCKVNAYDGVRTPSIPSVPCAEYSDEILRQVFEASIRKYAHDIRGLIPVGATPADENAKAAQALLNVA